MNKYSVRINTMKKLIMMVGLLVIFTVFSLLYINVPLKRQRSEYRSTDLKQVVTKYGNVTKTDYVDGNGNLRVAANTGYSTKLVVRQKDSEIETYLNDRGERVRLKYGHYGILREYDSDGNNIRVTFLDENNHPTVTALKYAVEEKEFNESGQQVSCRYLDAEGKPSQSYYNGFGARYEYNDKGRRMRTTYLDEAGEPMLLPVGYSTLVQEYYETEGPEYGKVKKEFYCLPDGTPASLSLGQYGIYKEYDENGQISLTVYLDVDGSPVVTKKGYTSVAFTYFADNSVQSTLYYDINGSPFQMREGQYGIKNQNGRTIYLNADGTERFNIRNFIYSNSRIVIVIVIALVLLSAFTDKKINWLMLAAYIGVIVYFTLMYREDSEAKIGVFNLYGRFFVNADARADIIKNIWLFIPFGSILFRLYPRKSTLVLPFLLSILIEAIQYYTGTGICTLDDVISNGFGGVVGYGMSSLVKMYENRFRAKANIISGE